MFIPLTCTFYRILSSYARKKKKTGNTTYYKLMLHSLLHNNYRLLRSFLNPCKQKISFLFPFSSFYICKRFFQKEKSLVNAVSASGVRAARQEDTVSYWEASVKSIFHRVSEKVPSIYFLHQIPFSS